MSETLTIQACAEHTNVTASALRYYERNGLIPSIARDHNGHRQYHAGDIEWIEFVICMRNTGMPLKEIRQFGELHFSNGSLRGRLRILEEHHERMLKQRVELDGAIDFIGRKVDRFTIGIAQLEETGAKT